jgi:GT2 family glycosyltransferase
LVSGPTLLERLASFPNEIEEELLLAHTYKPVAKDILIVTHDQLSYLKSCVQSIRDNTDQYRISLWINGSCPAVQEWAFSQGDISVTVSETNEGFIIPNNRLIEQSNNPFVILLNDDTVVCPGWDKAMIGYLQATGAAQVGYIGGWLDENAKGSRFGWGSGVDYIPGWCFAIPRSIYREYGLFDEENLKFAYGEDADFSLRLTAAGQQIYALHLGLVFHHENTTIKNLVEKQDLRTSFEENHLVLKRRWANRLALSRCGSGF